MPRQGGGPSKPPAGEVKCCAELLGDWINSYHHSSKDWSQISPAGGQSSGLWLKSQTPRQPIHLLQNGHFLSHTIMASSWFCKGLERCFIQLIIWHLTHHHRFCKDFSSLSFGQGSHYLSRHDPWLSLDLINPISLTSSLTLSPSTLAIWPHSYLCTPCLPPLLPQCLCTCAFFCLECSPRYSHILIP
jgi:hypothetical protein